MLPVTFAFRRPATLTALDRFVRFGRSEDGALTIFGLFIFLIMLVASGIALDLARSEADRTYMQATVDRAVLAAAAMEQEQQSQSVVGEYLDAAGFDRNDFDVRVEVTDNHRTVNIDGESRVNSLFMDILGQDLLVQPVSSTASQALVSLEVSLVLDISGSMGWTIAGGGSRMDQLKPAAVDFVTELLAARPDSTFISVVPYNRQVNAGDLIAEHFPLSREHTQSTCVTFEDTEFQTVGLAAGNILQRLAHYDASTTGDVNSAGFIEIPYCLSDENQKILPWSNNVGDLTAKINSLPNIRTTAIDLGAKWGAMLLDPSTRQYLTAMTTTPVDATDPNSAMQVSPVFAGQPKDYDNVLNRKVLVIMTDGENTSQADLDREDYYGLSDAAMRGYSPPSGVFVYRDGTEQLVSDADIEAGVATPTDVAGDSKYRGTWSRSNRLAGASTNWWENPRTRSVAAVYDVDTDGDGRAGEADDGTYYSFYSSTNGGRFFVPHLVSPSNNGYQSEPFGGTDAVELTYQEFFGMVNLDYVEDVLLDDADSDTRAFYGDPAVVTHNATRADTNLSRICAAARAQGITIYSIAFVAPTPGQTAMNDCAGIGTGSNEGFYYPVAVASDIDGVFDDILSSLKALRLTQ